MNLADLYIKDIRKEFGIPNFLIRAYFKFFGIPMIAKRCRFNAALSMIGDIKGKEVLDAGCGMGDMSLMLMKRGASVTGIDLDKEKLPTFGGGRFMASNIYDARGNFDMVVALDIIEHLRDDEGLIRVFNKVLKKKGILILSTPSIGRKINIQKEKRLGHVRYGYRIEELREILNENGFSIIEEKYVDKYNIVYYFDFINKKMQALFFPLLYPLSLIGGDRGTIISLKAEKK